MKQLLFEIITDYEDEIKSSHHAGHTVEDWIENDLEGILGEYVIRRCKDLKIDIQKIYTAVRGDE